MKEQKEISVCRMIHKNTLIDHYDSGTQTFHLTCGKCMSYVKFRRTLSRSGLLWSIKNYSHTKALAKPIALIIASYRELYKNITVGLHKNGVFSYFSDQSTGSYHKNLNLYFSVYILYFPIYRSHLYILKDGLSLSSDIKGGHILYWIWYTELLSLWLCDTV
jgi:hypothetical protein